MSIGKTETIRLTEASNSWESSVFRTRKLINYIHVEYTSDVTAGTRQIVLEILDLNGNVVWDSHAGSTQAANITRHYNFLPGIYRETSFIDNEIQVPISNRLIIDSNHTLKIYDENNVVATDSMVISYHTEELN